MQKTASLRPSPEQPAFMHEAACDKAQGKHPLFITITNISFLWLSAKQNGCKLREKPRTDLHLSTENRKQTIKSGTTSNPFVIQTDIGVFCNMNHQV